MRTGEGNPSSATIYHRGTNGGARNDLLHRNRRCVLFTLLYSNAIGTNGIGLELQVVTAIVLGGVSIWGGRGTLFGAIVGALLIGVLSKALQLLNVGSDVIGVITGGALILSVVVASIAGVFSRRRRRGAATQPSGGP